MIPEISIVVPSLHCESGKRTLRTFTQCIIDNTTNGYELLISSHVEESGTDAITYLSSVARGKYVAIICDDIYVAPGWDVAFLEAVEPDTLLIGSLIESGSTTVHECNVKIDYGHTPETFKREEFEKCAAIMAPLKPDTALRYWGFPWFVERELFAKRWAAENIKGDTIKELAGDFFFWRHWLDDGLKVKRANSWAYHLMRWTGKDYDYTTGRAR